MERRITKRCSNLAIVGGVLAIAAAGLGSGCGKKDGEGAGGKQNAPADPDPVVVKPDPFTGELTIERVLSVEGKVKPFDPWDQALPIVESVLGMAKVVEGQEFRWGVVSGDACAYFTVTKDNEKNFFKDKPDPKDMAGAVMKPTVVAKGDDNWTACLAAAGVKPEPEPEDPDAPAPPTDGSAIDVGALRTGVAAAKSKWVGAKVTVKGMYLSTTRTKAGESETVIVSVAESKGDLDTTVGCQLAQADGDKGLKQGDPITASGTVTDTFGGGLENCTIARVK